MASSEIRVQIKNLQYQQTYLEKELNKHGRAIDRLEKLSENAKSSSLEKREVTNNPPPPVTKKPKLDPTQVKVNPVGASARASKASPMSEISESSASSTVTDYSSEPSEPATLSPRLKQKPKAPKQSMKDLSHRELDFGKVWFVRLGIISLITGFVFLSNYTYQTYIASWGPAPRIIGLYLLSSIMLALGFYFEKAKEALSNYGKVLVSGGMALVYYTSYAAHHIERLQVIGSSLGGGVLLLTSAAACLGYALWRKSTTISLFSIVLMFYSTSINPVGGFTLVSSLILTATGLVLLQKLREASIGFTTMLAAYLSFAYWQCFVNHGSGYIYASWFVLGYWVLCTTITLTKRNLQMPFFDKAQSQIYTTLNNSLFIALTSYNFETLTLVPDIWRNFAAIGVIFLIIARYLYVRENDSVKDSSQIASLAHLYLGKGFALIALALWIKLSGPSLVISLAVQATLAIVSGTLKHRKVHLGAGFTLLFFGFVYYMILIFNGDTQNLNSIHHVFLFCTYLFIATFVHLKGREQWIRDCIPFASVLSIITLITLITTAGITIFVQSLIFFTLFITIRAIAGISLFKYVPKPFFHLTHIFPILAFVLTLGILVTGELDLQRCLIILILSLGAAAIQMISTLKWKHLEVRYNFTLFYNICFTLMLLIFLSLTKSENIAVISFSCIPIVYHFLYHKVKITNIPFISVLCYSIPWLILLSQYQGLGAPDISAVSLAACSLIPLLHHYLIKHEYLIDFDEIYPLPFQSLISIALVAASTGLISLWQIEYVAQWEVLLAVTATLFYYLEDKTAHHSYSISALCMYAYALFSTLSSSQDSFWMSYIVMSIPFITYVINRYQSDRTAGKLVNQCIAVTFSLTLWFLVSNHAVEEFGSSARSISWALIGLTTLSIGFLTKDILFRSVAFIILGCSVIHVFGVDVWGLTAILRIFSFITLGVVLLLIGYLYSRKVDEREEAEDE